MKELVDEAVKIFCNYDLKNGQNIIVNKDDIYEIVKNYEKLKTKK